MDEPSLQTTLHEKYNMDDILLAEGRFVGLIGDHATNLLCLGLGLRYLVIARVVLSGDVMDYELLSLLPLKMLSMSFQNLAKKIKVRSQFKSTQVYQLCSSANQAEVWDNFTSTIREVYVPEQGDIWCSPTLQTPQLTVSTTTTTMEELPGQNSVNLNRPFIDNSQYSSISKTSYLTSSTFSKLVSKLSESSVSLPTKLPSLADDTHICPKDSSRTQSMINVDIQFDNFVNDVHTNSSDPSELSLSLTSKIDNQNTMDNFVEVQDIPKTYNSVSRKKKERQDGYLSRLFKRILYL